MSETIIPIEKVGGVGYSQTIVGDGSDSITFTKQGVFVNVQFAHSTYGANGNSQTISNIIPSGYLPKKTAGGMGFSNSVFQRRFECRADGSIYIGPTINSGTEGGTNKTGIWGTITYITE